MKSKTNRKYYIMLFIVVISWGCDPVINRHLYNYYSAAALSALCTFVCALTFLFLARKKLHLLKDKKYLLRALPICLFNSLACVLQRIGLQYTSPARYAFLEHLSCAAVPLILFFIFKRKPNALQIVASVLCLSGCLVLSGAGVFQSSVNVGDALCAAAGILLGFGIVFTAMCTHGLDITLFMALHMCTYFLTSISLAVAMNFIRIDGAPMEAFVFTLSPLTLIFAALFGLFTVGICWLLRNEATRHVHPTAVAVIAPFSALITAVISILQGMERATPSFLIACTLILASAVLAGLSEEAPSEEVDTSAKT
jgi:drug/metabolite transporter (DMT)-like permease